MCVVGTCCCGLVSLKTGCIIIGWIDLALGLIAAIDGLYIIITNLDRAEAVGLSAVDVLLAIIIIILGLLLIQGARKERPGYVKTWFYVSLVCVAAQFLFGLTAFILGYHWLDVILNIIIAGISTYFLIVVRSYFLLLQGDLVPSA